jgi:hypothetical protein
MKRKEGKGRRGQHSTDLSEDKREKEKSEK